MSDGELLHVLGARHHSRCITHRLRRQNELIGNAHRMVSETEEVGMEITAELARNREKIESSRAKVVFSLPVPGLLCQ